MRRRSPHLVGWSAGIATAAALSVEVLWNVAGGLFGFAAYRWWLLGAAIAVSVGLVVGVVVTRVREHRGDEQERATHHDGAATAGADIAITATDGGLVQFTAPAVVGGSQNQMVVTVQAPVTAAQAIELPTGVHNLPAASMVFVGRDVGLVEAALTAGGGVIGQAVHGLGGVGKTELAAHYAHTRSGRYGLRWWITADTPDNITLGLASLAQRLHPIVEVAAARAWALTWLQTHQGWLLILDNVEDPEDIRGLLGQLRGHGQVLVTTRRDLGSARWTTLGLAPLHLEVLERTASVSLLQRLTGDPDGEEAHRLAAELGDLPLALEQAAAYVTQNPRLSLRGYRRLLAVHPDRIYATAGVGNQPDRAVTRVWQATTTRITHQSPLTARLLAVLSYLAPDNLPESVLAPLADQLELNDALALLASYSMITRTVAGVSMHRLVQAITRTGTPPEHDGSQPPLAEAIRLLRNAAPADPLTSVDGWVLWRALLPHAAAVLGHLTQQHDNTDVLHLADQAAIFNYGQGQLGPAIAMFERVLTDRRRVLGADHPDTLTSRNNLAGAYATFGRISEAITLHGQNLTDRTRLLGGDHPDTLQSRNNLAVAYQRSERVDEAIALYEQNLADYRRLLGKDHADTLRTCNNLGNAYRTAGRVDEAISLHEQNLADRERVLGHEHPETLQSRSNLARAYQTAGRIDESITLFEQNLTDRERVLGDQHPDTLNSRSDLANAYQAAGRIDEGDHTVRAESH